MRLALIVAEELGLDRSLPTQYFSWLAAMLQGNFGTSIRTGLPVLSQVRERESNRKEVRVVSAQPVGITKGDRRGENLFLDQHRLVSRARGRRNGGSRLAGFWKGRTTQEAAGLGAKGAKGIARPRGRF